jgi:hypothetical protein
MAQDSARYSFHDYDREPTSVNVNTVEITAANLDAQTTLAQALRTAINGLILGGVEQGVISDAFWDTVVPVTSPFAQREIKWTIISQDVSGNRFRSNELPMANLALLENASKYIVKNGIITVVAGAVAVQAFIDAYEAFAVSNNGEALTVIDIYQSGRNS